MRFYNVRLSSESTGLLIRQIKKRYKDTEAKNEPAFVCVFATDTVIGVAVSSMTLAEVTFCFVDTVNGAGLPKRV